MDIIINEIDVDGHGLSEGDEIGVFEQNQTTLDYFCVGSYYYRGNETFPLQVVVWESVSSQGLAGFTDGNNIVFRLWGTSFDSTTEMIPQVVWVEGDGAFGSGEFSVVSLNAESNLDPVIAIDVSSLSFSATRVGSSSSQNVYVYNSGLTNLVISSISTSDYSFSASPGYFSLAPGDTQAVVFSFEPSSALPYTGTLSINSNDQDRPALTVSVEGQGLPDVFGKIQALNPSQQFQPTARGDTATISFSLFNAGSGQITVSSVDVGDSSFFTSWNNFTIDPGQTVSLPLYFTPGLNDDVGVYNTTVNVNNNSANRSNQTLMASGLLYEGFFQVVDPTGLPYTIVIDSLVGPLDSVQLGDEIGIFDGSTPVGVVLTTSLIPSAETSDYDFESFYSDSSWSTGNTDVDNTGNKILGRFGNQTIEYTEYNLHVHDSITIVFDLYVIDSWNGDEPWRMYLDGEEIVTRYFNANQISEGNIYHGNLGFASHHTDNVYRLEYTLPHSSTNIILSFTGSGLQDLNDESWGIDNFSLVLPSSSTDLGSGFSGIAWEADPDKDLTGFSSGDPMSFRYFARPSMGY